MHETRAIGIRNMTAEDVDFSAAQALAIASGRVPLFLEDRNMIPYGYCPGGGEPLPRSGEIVAERPDREACPYPTPGENGIIEESYLPKGFSHGT